MSDLDRPTATDNEVATYAACSALFGAAAVLLSLGSYFAEPGPGLFLIGLALVALTGSALCWRLMLVAWAAGLVEIAMIVGFSSQIVDLVAKLFS